MRSLLGWLILHFAAFCLGSETQQIYSWKSVDVVDAEKAGTVGGYPVYAASGNHITGIGYHAKSGTMIVTIPRRQPGIPATVGAFCAKDWKKGSSPKIFPIPNARVNALKEGFFSEAKEMTSIETVSRARRAAATDADTTKPIISVSTPIVDDKCNRLWFLDTGVIWYPDQIIVVQRPSLWVVKLPEKSCSKDAFKVLKRIEFSDDQIGDISGLSDIALDFAKNGTCDDVYAYIPDSVGHQIVVHDYRAGKTWAFRGHYSFDPVVRESAIVAGDRQYVIEEGVTSLTLGWRDTSGYRAAYYIPLSGTGQFAVSTQVLKEESRAPANFHPEDFKLIGYRGQQLQAYRHVFDPKNGIIFYADAQEQSIRCWNVRRPLTPDHIGVTNFNATDVEGLDLMIDSRGDLWILANKPLKFRVSEMDTKEVNARLFRLSVSDAIRGTLCEDSSAIVEEFDEAERNVYKNSEDFIH
ncbi:L-dopachrome tautomerase yellow-f2-like [Lutzomyia longipalpis]|uniref:L-dopachrome tautomerase yellow-f2-like n=1 Tax=Lutzomyia longipalpis TaxID=7200 RepID=UPI002483BB5D|nr:L-dopachrome tautomerase yellow-f2-like [Lutzomyia longipalpis]